MFSRAIITLSHDIMKLACMVRRWHCQYLSRSLCSMKFFFIFLFFSLFIYLLCCFALLSWTKFIFVLLAENWWWTLAHRPFDQIKWNRKNEVVFRLKSFKRAFVAGVWLGFGLCVGLRLKKKIIKRKIWHKKSS